MNWKSRNDLPGLIKLDIKYNIGMLRKDIHEYVSRDLKDSMEEGPYKNLRDAYGYNLSPAAYGKTNEEVIQHYAKNGITIPESFISKVKKQFENYKKLKLELGFMQLKKN